MLVSSIWLRFEATCSVAMSGMVMGAAPQRDRRVFRERRRCCVRRRVAVTQRARPRSGVRPHRQTYPTVQTACRCLRVRGASQSIPASGSPCVRLVLQGSKQMLVGEQRFRYGAGSCFAALIELDDAPLHRSATRQTLHRHTLLIPAIHVAPHGRKRWQSCAGWQRTDSSTTLLTRGAMWTSEFQHIQRATAIAPERMTGQA